MQQTPLQIAHESSVLINSGALNRSDFAYERVVRLLQSHRRVFLQSR